MLILIHHIYLLLSLSFLCTYSISSNSSKCPIIVYPPPMHVIQQQSTLSIILSHEPSIITTNVIIHAFPTINQLKPLPKYVLSSSVSLTKKSKSSSLTISSINLPINTYGLYICRSNSIDQECEECHEFVIVSIVASSSSLKHKLLRERREKKKLLQILSPLESSIYQFGFIDIFIYFDLSIVKRFCFQLSSDDEIKCDSTSNIVQPIQIETVSLNNHLLKIWDENNTKLMDVVSFDVQLLNQLSRINIITPQIDQIMNANSVWLKFMISPYTDDSKGKKVCINIDNKIKACELDIHQPHQLFNLKEGKHQVCVWDQNVKIEQNIKTCHSFIVTEYPTNEKEINNEMTKNNNNKMSWKKKQDDGTFTIIIFACSRPDQLKQLWLSLINAVYMNHIVNLIVFIDQPSRLNYNKVKTDYNKIIRFVKYTMKKEWLHGSMKYVIREKSYGLKKSIMNAWKDEKNGRTGIHNDSDRLIFLEDDVIVSQYFFIYLILTSRKTNEMEKNLAGISLYSPSWNEISWTLFQPNDNMIPFYLLQLPCSWGTMYYTTVWSNFLNWYDDNYKKFDLLNVSTLPLIHRSMTNTWNYKKSWKLYMLRYMMENHLYLLYPKDNSYSTTKMLIDSTNIKNAKSLSVLFDVPLTTALQPFLSSDSLIKNISFYDVEHNCRKNCRKKKMASTAKNISKQCLSSSSSATIQQTSMVCTFDDDTSKCELKNIGFNRNSFIYYSSSSTLPTSTTSNKVLPFIPSSYRHRCCLENMPSFTIQKQLISSKCKIQNTIQTFTLMIGGLFQYGHFLHDIIISLYSTLLTAMHGDDDNADDDLINIIKNKNIQIIITNNNINQSDIIQHPLYTVIRTLLTRHKIWILNDFKKHRSFSIDGNSNNNLICFQHLIFGTSYQSNLYMNSSYHHSHLHQFTRDVHLLFSIQQQQQQQQQKQQYHLHIVTRDHAKSRKILNINEIIHYTTKISYYSITTGDFGGTSFQKQYHIFQNINVLCAVHGTALLNSLFLKRDAIIIIIMPFGTHHYIGINTYNAANIYPKNRYVYLLHQHPHSSVYNTDSIDILNNGRIIKDENKYNNIIHQLNPINVWKENWMNGFSLYVNIIGLYVNVTQLIHHLNIAFSILAKNEKK